MKRCIDIQKKSTLLGVLAFSLLWQGSPALAWNARYFQHNERDVYDNSRPRVSPEKRDWTAYYFPFYQGPASFRPSDFMAPSRKDCFALCDSHPAPFANSEDCRNACIRPHENLCRKKSVKKCLREKGLFSLVVPVFKGHNWLTNVAVWTLKKHGLWFEEISDRDLKYIHYGINFADHPWTGRPDAADAGRDRVVGVWDLEKRNLRNALFDRDKSPGRRYLVESRFRSGRLNSHSDSHRPNLYLSVRHKAVMFEKNKITAADNLFHFPNRDAASGSGKSVRLRSFDAIDKDAVFEKCDVSAMKYGVVLFQLSRQFWPGNPDIEPDISALARIYSHKGPGSPETGAIVIDHLLGPGEHVERAYLPSTYLGGNPFICAPDPGKRILAKYENDLCRFGPPTWPVWVPNDSQFLPSGEGDCFEHTCKNRLSPQCLKRPQCVRDFHVALKNRSPGKSQKTALIYLGWALHLIQDTAMPRHAANWLGSVHENIETEADRMIKLGYGMRSREDGGFSDWQPFYTQVDQMFGSGRSRRQICRDLALDGNYRFEHEGLKALFDSVRDDAYRDRKRIKGRKKKTSTRREEYIQIAFQRSILASMKLLVCLEIGDS